MLTEGHRFENKTFFFFVVLDKTCVDFVSCKDFRKIKKEKKRVRTTPVFLMVYKNDKSVTNLKKQNKTKKNSHFSTTVFLTFLFCNIYLAFTFEEKKRTKHLKKKKLVFKF